MTFHDDLARDYGVLCDRLSRRFGTAFEIASTGGGCYAIAATLENGDLLLVTDAADATLNPLAQTTGVRGRGMSRLADRQRPAGVCGRPARHGGKYPGPGRGRPAAAKRAGMNGLASRFERLASGVILANSAVLVWGWLDHGHEAVAERIDTCLLVFFAAELLVRLRRAGWRWLARPWNILDAAIVLVALLPVVGDSITVLRIARAARILHLGRHTGHLRALAWLGRRRSVVGRRMDDRSETTR